MKGPVIACFKFVKLQVASFSLQTQLIIVIIIITDKIQHHQEETDTSDTPFYSLSVFDPILCCVKAKD